MIDPLVLVRQRFVVEHLAATGKVPRMRPGGHVISERSCKCGKRLAECNSSGYCRDCYKHLPKSELKRLRAARVEPTPEPSDPLEPYPMPEEPED